MKLGLWGARADNRGLGVQTAEFHRHMKPERTVVVDMGDLSPYALHLDRFPGAEVVRHGQITEDDMRRFLDGLDVVYMAETAYDDRFYDVARAMGVRTVVHVNHEFNRWLTDKALGRPDLFLAPSTWGWDQFPRPRALQSFPVARDRLPFVRRTKVETVLHIMGPGTHYDRNGTSSLLDALRFVAHPCRVLIRCQGQPPGLRRRWGPHVQVDVERRDVDDYWQVYEGADALVMTRRYGGLCLPINEAASLGLPVVVTDRDPERNWFPPDLRVRAPRSHPVRCPVGRIAAAEPDPRTLAARLNALLRDETAVERASEASDAYAARIAWSAAMEPFRAVLAGTPAVVPQ